MQGECNMPLAIVRGGGDLATGIIYRLWKIGFVILVLETSRPTAIRRPVSVAQAIFEKTRAHTIDGMKAILISSISSFREMPDDGNVSVLIDPHGSSIARLKPDLLVDAIMAKRNCGTTRDMAPRVVAIGPGFRAPGDVHAVVETMRGHNLGRVITNGEAAPNTGVPGEIGGKSIDRIVRSPAEGTAYFNVAIGDNVKEGQIIGFVGGTTLDATANVKISARASGVVRGLVHPSVYVRANMKIGDIDPRAARENCFSISDKSLAIAGGVLEAALSQKLAF
jgi:xanthine dehydrogenase accessory factor